MLTVCCVGCFNLSRCQLTSKSTHTASHRYYSDHISLYVLFQHDKNWRFKWNTWLRPSRFDSIYRRNKKNWIYEATKKEIHERAEKQTAHLLVLSAIFRHWPSYSIRAICSTSLEQFVIEFEPNIPSIFFLLLFIFAFMLGLCSRFRSHSCSHSTLSLTALKTYTRNYSVKCNLSAS